MRWNSGSFSSLRKSNWNAFASNYIIMMFCIGTNVNIESALAISNITIIIMTYRKCPLTQEFRHCICSFVRINTSIFQYTYGSHTQTINLHHHHHQLHSPNNCTYRILLWFKYINVIYNCDCNYVKLRLNSTHIDLRTTDNSNTTLPASAASSFDIYHHSSIRSMIYDHYHHHAYVPGLSSDVCRIVVGWYSIVPCFNGVLFHNWSSIIFADSTVTISFNNWFSAISRNF